MSAELFLIAISIVIVIGSLVLLAMQNHAFEQEKQKIETAFETRIAEQRSNFAVYTDKLEGDNRDLRDRLFVKHGLAPSGVNLTAERAEKIKIEREKKDAAPNLPKGRGLVAQAQMAAIAEDEAEYQKQQNYYK